LNNIQKTHPCPNLMYTISLHDALPIWPDRRSLFQVGRPRQSHRVLHSVLTPVPDGLFFPRRSPTLKQSGRGIYLRRRQRESASRSEEHTSELQSPCNIVCRLLLEKKK